MMATEISIPSLTGSTNYELWKLQTQAWTVVTELSKEKQALAVALNLPDDDKRKIKEKVFGELELDVLNSENGMSVLFEFLDRYLLEDELMNSWNKFEDFEKFERKHGQNIREYVADFDLKFRKLEKIHIKLPSEILAFKLLRNANLSKQERMLVLTGVNFAEKEKMYVQTKHSLIKFMGDLKEEKASMGPNVRLEPGWKKLVSCSYNLKGSVEHGSNGVMKKKLNPLGLNGQILLCNSCGSYRHLVAECQDSWENIAKRKNSEFNVKLRGQSDKNKLKGEENRSRESVELGEVSGVPIANKQLVEEVTQMKADIRNLKTEIEKIMVVKDKEVKMQKEEFLSHVRIVKQENEGQQKESGTTLQMLIQSMIKLQKEVKLLGTDHDRQTRKKMKLNENNRTKQRLLEKAKKVKLKLQMTPEKTNTSSWISEKKMKQKLDTDEASPVRQWFWWPVETQQINDTTLQSTTGNWFLKLLHNRNVLNDI